MNAARILRQARRRAGLSQRELARRVGVPQPSVARIESGVTIPRVDTLDRLLRACGETIEALPVVGIGVDLSQIDEMLAMAPAARARYAVASARNIIAFKQAARFRQPRQSA